MENQPVAIAKAQIHVEGVRSVQVLEHTIGEKFVLKWRRHDASDRMDPPLVWLPPGSPEFPTRIAERLIAGAGAEFYPKAWLTHVLSLTCFMLAFTRILGHCAYVSRLANDDRGTE